MSHDPDNNHPQSLISALQDLFTVVHINILFAIDRYKLRQIYRQGSYDDYHRAKIAYWEALHRRYSDKWNPR